MALTDNIRSASENAVESIATRLADLPKPIAAVVGAGEMAAERIAALRSQIVERFEERGAIINVPAAPNPAELAGDLRTAAGELPGRVQQLAAELPGKVSGAASGVAHQVEDFAGSVPGKVSQFVEELPGKASEFAGQLRPDTIRHTAEAYVGVVSSMYDNLAEHGQDVWDKVRQNIAPESATVVDAPRVATPAAAARRARTSAPKPAAPNTAAAANTARRSTAAGVKPTVKATAKTAATKTAATKAAPAKPATRKPAPKPTAAGKRAAAETD